jgi:hypothetical protein
MARGPSVRNRQYTTEFKVEVLRLAESAGPAEAARRRELANAALDAKVASIHAISGQSYGRPRIVRHLLAQGIRVGPERVRRSLQRQQLRPVYKRPSGNSDKSAI